MAFSTIFIIVIIGYVFLYGGMIVYDLCFKKDPAEFLPKQEDEDIDISDEVGQFKPILIEKDPKPDGKKTEQPLAAEKVEEDTGSNGGTTETIPPVSSETADDEPKNRKSLNDVEPKPTSKEQREKIRELVKQVRKDMDGEDEGTSTSTEVPKEKADKTAKPKVEVKTGGTTEAPTNNNASPKGTASGTTSSPTSSGTSSSPRKSNVTHKPESTKKIVRPWEREAKRTGPIPVYEWKARVNPDNQKTKVCGGETAESFSSKLNSYSIQELRALCAKNNDHWDALEKARQPTEDDLEIIRMAESGTRKKPPSFTRNKT